MTSVEPPLADSEFWDTLNILISPHPLSESARTQEFVTAIMRRNLLPGLVVEPLDIL